jgi:hypothetical protein
VVLHGGVVQDGVGAVNTTWQLKSDDTWGEICSSATLPALYSPAFGFDPRGQQLVVAGGSSTEDFKTPTTAVWTCSSSDAGATWVQHVVPLPRAVVGAQLVSDGARLILVGGNDDTGEYMREAFATTDLLAWQQIGAASPAAFGGAATNITYDVTNERVLALKNYTAAFGRSPEPTDELWELRKDAGHWSLICGPSASGCGWKPRFEAALAHFPASDSTFAIGGTGGSPTTEFEGSWILDDNELVHSHDDPPARDRAAMIYDDERQRLVVFGGNGRGCDGDCASTWILELND